MHGGAAEPARIFERVGEQREYVLRFERLQHKHLAPRQQRAVHFKRRIFGSGAYQDDTALFHIRQKGVLLRFVESVDLVYEQDGFFAEPTVLLRPFHHLLYLFDTAGHRRKIDERRPRGVRDHPRQRGLAHARRPPKDHGADTVVLYEPPQDLALADQMFLPRHFAQIAGTQARGQRQTFVVRKKRFLFHNRISIAHFFALCNSYNSSPKRSIMADLCSCKECA